MRKSGRSGIHCLASYYLHIPRTTVFYVHTRIRVQQSLIYSFLGVSANSALANASG